MGDLLGAIPLASLGHSLHYADQIADLDIGVCNEANGLFGGGG